MILLDYKSILGKVLKT